MSTMLGKRKRILATPSSAAPIKKSITTKKVKSELVPQQRKPQPQKAQPQPKQKEEEEDEEDQDAMREAFRRAFEARFKPLDGLEEHKQKELEAAAQAELEEDDSEDEAWDGIDGEEDDELDQVEVIEHTTVAQREKADKAALKAFMSSKPPSDTTSKPTTTTSKTKNDTKDDVPEAEDDLKNDLALQRLLTESHLLDTNFSSTDPSGSNRHKATDLRLLSLGAKTSVFSQKNMPMSHRKGIQGKKVQREEERRRDAKENGIVLERERKEGKAEKRRERGIGGPSVGRFSGGMLKLSKRDVEGITGPKVLGKGGRGGRGGKGGRGRGGKR